MSFIVILILLNNVYVFLRTIYTTFSNQIIRQGMKGVIRSGLKVGL